MVLEDVREDIEDTPFFGDPGHHVPLMPGPRYTPPGVQLPLKHAGSKGSMQGAVACAYPACGGVQWKDGSGRTFVSSGNDPETVSLSSRLKRDGMCGAVELLQPMVRAIPVPEMELFTPPFQVVTRGDLEQ